MAIETSLSSSLKLWLEKDKGIRICSEWIEACVQWIVDNEMPEEDTDLQYLVFEQLLHADLRGIVDTGCFDGINFLNAGALNGSFIVQVNSVVDVSCPSHKSSEHSSNNRLLSLTITDGHTELLAVEYKHINALNMKLELGTKMLLHGKMRYNLGVLLLCPEDVTLLGGVVSGLDESDKQDALLHDVIGGPGNEDSCIFVDDFSKLCSDIWEKHPHIIVKGQPSSVENICHASGGWGTTVLLQNDAGVKLEVAMSNEVLEELIGVSTTHFSKYMLPNKPEVQIRKKAGTGFSYCQSFMSTFNSYLMLSWNSAMNLPVIVKLLDAQALD